MHAGVYHDEKTAIACVLRGDEPQLQTLEYTLHAREERRFDLTEEKASYSKLRITCRKRRHTSQPTTTRLPTPWSTAAVTRLNPWVKKLGQHRKRGLQTYPSKRTGLA